MKKNKYILFLFLSVIFLFLTGGFVSALEVTSYPSIPGLSAPTADSGLPAFVAYWFGLLIYIAVIISLISFTIGAVGLINPSAEAKKDAKDRMKGAMLGLILSVASFIIIRTINTALITPSLTPLPGIIAAPAAIQPGVYFYLTSDCSDQGSSANISSEDLIGDPFAENIKSVKIINDPANNIYYGIIFHKEIGLVNGGDCMPPIMGAGCHPVDMHASAADIFKLNISNPPTSSGNGVVFYTEAYGSATGASQNRGEGVCTIKNSEIKNTLFQENAKNMWFGSGDCAYTKNATEKYRKAYPKLQDRPGSIDIRGNYIVAIFDSKSQSDDNNYCQTFTKNAPNLNIQPFLATGHLIGNIYIIPAQ